MILTQILYGVRDGLAWALCFPLDAETRTDAERSLWGVERILDSLEWML